MQIQLLFRSFLIYGLILCSIMIFINFLRITFLSTTDKSFLFAFYCKNGFYCCVAIEGTGVEKAFRKLYS